MASYDANGKIRFDLNAEVRDAIGQGFAVVFGEGLTDDSTSITVEYVHPTRAKVRSLSTFVDADEDLAEALANLVHDAGVAMDRSKS